MLFTVLRGWRLGAIREVILAEVVGCFRIVDNQKLLNVALQLLVFGFRVLSEKTRPSYVKIVLVVNFLSE